MTRERFDAEATRMREELRRETCNPDVLAMFDLCRALLRRSVPEQAKHE